jgi:hypothetical protein
MPFYHDHTYQRVQLEEQTNNGHTVMWELVGSFNGDFVAGVVSGIYILLKDHVINYGGGDGSYFKHRISAHIDDNGTGSIYVPVGDDAGYRATMAPYLGHIGVKPDDIPEYQAPPDGYAWWFRDQDLYDMYVFSDPEFPQGFISVCDAFEVDFRDYIAGPPFSLDPGTRENVPLIVTGYDIAPFKPEQIVAAAPAPYYTMIIEGDRYGVNFV